jgi:DNA-binding transcriptional MerR regulator
MQVDSAGPVDHTVGDVARAAGVTVRTLHHYDEIGLLVPSGRSAAGYRLYTYDDLLRLQRVLGYRALGLALDEIAELLDDPAADPVAQLRAQHAALTDRIAALQLQLAALTQTMEAHQMGIQLTPQEMLEVFGDTDPTQHAAEAQERWGETEAYRESQRRTSRYTKADWQRMKVESEAVESALAAAYASGEPAGSVAAMDAAEAHRRSISTWFYACTYEIHRGLAQMYVTDERFAAHYDDRAPGLAQYVHDAVLANAARAGA